MPSSSKDSMKRNRQLPETLLAGFRTAKGVDDSDWTFNIAYNAVLKLATVPLYAEGYRADKMNNHYRTFQAIPLIIGKEQKASAAYLDKCRQKRNSATYDRVAVVSKKEAKELIDFAEEFKEVITTWLDEKHPELAAKVRSELKTIED